MNLKLNFVESCTIHNHNLSTLIHQRSFQYRISITRYRKSMGYPCYQVILSLVHADKYFSIIRRYRETNTTIPSYYSRPEAKRASWSTAFARHRQLESTISPRLEYV